ncbi:acyl-CoA dehydrogenase family protein [Halostagnicola sp. A-GB9-2]|uniref:acyl-CoA dehydrogenase family protein n=1 Tax=Halostagnicola sp. A-GB9-2 TaxID=3048066 RepID=UPI0024C0A3E8|nr:acyl-CoA dehydrogenase family protein [Halostagnicola sp. A-GB9-2]MDJ1430512.1 acyl-CoA dehydrogenase family protein [Halostagnicola sp. A-GB9-2]
MNPLEDSIVPDRALDVKTEASEFAREHIEPNAAEYYESGDYPWDILEAAQEAGLAGQDIPETWGGRGLDLPQLLAITEEFYRADAGIALTIQLASFGCEITYEYGSDEQCEEYVRPVAEGDQLSGLAVSEPETGSDLAGMQTSAEQDGNEYVLNGEKYWIGNGVEADWVTVYARTGDDGNNRYGNHSMFIVPTDTDGYEAEHIPEKMAMPASKQAHITFDDCTIPESNLIGHEGAGFMMLADFFNHGRIVVSGHGLGLAAAAIEEAWEFTHEREEFGRTINEFQAVQHGLADMLVEFESARALVWRACRKVESDENAGYWAALSKTKATETAVDVAEQGMQFHGGRSILDERRIARVYRDVRVPVIYEGANEVQRNLIYGQAP